MIERIFQAFLIFFIVFFGLSIIYGPRGLESTRDYQNYKAGLQESVVKMKQLSRQLKSIQEHINNQKERSFDGVFTQSRVHTYRHPQLTDNYTPFKHKGWIPPLGALITTLLYIAFSLFIYRAKSLKLQDFGTSEASASNPEKDAQLDAFSELKEEI